MTMWLAIGKFFSAVLKFILGIFTGILNYARKHPREFAIILFSVFALIVSNFWMHRWATAKQKEADAKVISALQAEVKKANDEAKARNEKIERIEKESKAKAGELERALTESKQTAKEIVSDYERKLKDERKNYRVIYVKDKDGKDVPVNVDPQGSVVCEKFSQTFQDSVNRLVDNANKPLNLKLTPEVKK